MPNNMQNRTRVTVFIGNGFLSLAAATTFLKYLPATGLQKPKFPSAHVGPGGVVFLGSLTSSAHFPGGPTTYVGVVLVRGRVSREPSK